MRPLFSVYLMTGNILFLCVYSFSCMVWASYGVVKGDDALVPVNVIGMITQVLFTLCFFLYCKERVCILRLSLQLMSIGVTHL